MPFKGLIRSALLLLLCSTFATAQTYHFSNYSVKDGLAQSNVSGIAQDTAGFYWIATAGGISRFDGKNFQNFTTENGLTDNNVSSIFVDRDHQLWLGHENGTLSKYDGKRFAEIKSRLLPKDKKIYSFFQEKSGGLWVCTETAGSILIVDPKPDKGSYQTRVYSGKEGLSNYVFTATEDKQGNIWFLTDIGIKIYYRATRKFDFFRPEGLPFLGQFSALNRDEDMNMIIGTTNGAILKYEPASKKVSMIVTPEKMMQLVGNSTQPVIYTLLEDRKDNLWASISNTGVLRFNKKTGKAVLFNTGNGISVNQVKCMFEDREGNILIGTVGEGIEVFSSERFVAFSKRNGVIDNQVWAICKDNKGRYWFGTNEGITVYDPAAPKELAYHSFTKEDGLPGNKIRAITSDKSGNLWIATWGGRVIKYDIQSSRFVPVAALNDIVNIYVSALLVDSRNRLWIGTSEGIVIYDLATAAIRTMRTIDGLSDNDVMCIFEDSKSRIWIGTKQKGATMYDGQKLKVFNRENGLNYNNISSITEDKQHNIWFGTEGGGVFRYDGNKFSNLRIKDGLASDFITLLAPDAKGNIWIGSNKGLNKFDGKTSEFRTFNIDNGFTGVETKPRAAYTDNNGDMWFGTVNGAYRYSPALDLAVLIKPITKILRFRVGLEDRPIANKIKLSYLENTLTFDFIGISLSNPQSIYYKVKLEGYEDQWKVLQDYQSELAYSNLPDGKYTFNLVSCNDFDVCSDPIVIQIEITPPYWKTWWFYLIAITVIVSGLFTYIKIRERALREEKRILEEKVNERTAEVVEKNKELDEINKDITASIRYAKRIQDAILPPDDFVRKTLPNTFVLFKPKDIVSGDFYWMEEKNDHIVFAAVDCTGHGVPGAFMSIVGHNVLDRVVGEYNLTEPARILDELNKGISDALRQSTLEDNTVRDGMDIAMCSFNRKTGVLQFAGAYNPLWIIRKNELIEVKANKFPIGNSRMGDNQKFTNHEIQLEKGDTIYIFSDGYCDQFGGPAGKKFKASALRQLLTASQHLNMAEQKQLLDKTIEDWRGTHEQVDDILIIGTRY